MLLAVAANRRSGRGIGSDEIVRYLTEAGARVEVLGLDDLRTSLPAGVDRVVVAGGDGSIGSAARAAHEAGVPLGVIPTGTANDFARALRLPLDVRRACELAADPAAGTRHHEIGFIDGRPFVNMAAAGLSVAASRHAEAHKSATGKLAYALGAVRAGATAAPLQATVSCDGEQRFSGDAWQIVVGVTGAFGGGSAIGGTLPDDARLDVAVVPRCPRPALTRYAYAMRRGTLTRQRRVRHHRGRVIDVELPPGAAFNVDGEVLEFRPARFTLLAGGVRVVTPARWTPSP